MESLHARQTHPQILPFSADTNARYDILGDHTNLSITPMGEPSPHLYKTGRKPSDQEVLDTLTQLSGRVTGEDRLMLPEGQSVRSFMAEMSRQGFAAEDGRDYSDATDAEMLDAMTFNVFLISHPGAVIRPTSSIAGARMVGDVDSTLMEVMLLKRNP